MDTGSYTIVVQYSAVHISYYRDMSVLYNKYIQIHIQV